MNEIKERYSNVFMHPPHGLNQLVALFDSNCGWAYAFKIEDQDQAYIVLKDDVVLPYPFTYLKSKDIISKSAYFESEEQVMDIIKNITLEQVENLSEKVVFPDSGDYQAIEFTIKMLKHTKIS